MVTTEAAEGIGTHDTVSASCPRAHTDDISDCEDDANAVEISFFSSCCRSCSAWVDVTTRGAEPMPNPTLTPSTSATKMTAYTSGCTTVSVTASILTCQFLAKLVRENHLPRKSSMPRQTLLSKTALCLRARDAWQRYDSSCSASAGCGALDAC